MSDQKRPGKSKSKPRTKAKPNGILLLFGPDQSVDDIYDTLVEQHEKHFGDGGGKDAGKDTTNVSPPESSV